ncbi:hypothetical protein [Zavarzinia sp.]|uniref:hypothetical protein n=1 Tax=Zavarzinia sp. TaxID=2027920 RepID=UPI003BB623D1
MIRKILARIGLVREAAPEVPAPAQRVVEARDDEAGWRPVSQSKRDLSPVTQKRMMELAHYAWEQHRVANRLIELPLAFILGDGVSIKVDDDEAQAWLDAWWGDPITRLDLNIEKRVRELALFGEQLIITFVNPIDGHVRHGAIDPSAIAEVVTDPENSSLPIGVTVETETGVKRTYKVILDGEDAELLRVPALVLRDGMTAGECHFWRINDLLTGCRGRSDLLSAIDLADALSQLIFGEVERAVALRSMVWDVKVTGATPDDIDELSRKMEPPAPMSIRVHNESVEWNVLSPKLESADAAGTLRSVRNEILGGASIPEHWFGGGGDVNRATAAEMDEPTYKVFRRRQLLWKAILEAEARYVLRRRLIAQGRSPRELDRPEMKPKADFPTMQAIDVSRYAQALGQVVSACAAAISAGLMTDEIAVGLIALVAGKMGIEIDAEAMLADARAASEKRREADAFATPPVDPVEPVDPAKTGDAQG